MSDLAVLGVAVVIAALIALASSKASKKTGIPTWVWAVVLCAAVAGGAYYAGLLA